MRLHKSVFLCLISTLFTLNSFAQFYYGSQTSFGKNRIQYKKSLYWTYFSYPRYDVYFYEGGKEIASYVSKSTQKNLTDLEKLFDSELSGRLTVIVYNKQSEFKQSNLGLSTEEEFNIGGTTRIVGTKVIVYFEGDHQKLEEQIRSSIAEILINQMMYGGSVTEMLKNSTLLALPEWYVKGLAAHLGAKWNADIDNKVRDGILNKRYKKFNQLSGPDALYAGRSIWNYISETYGESVISNILYMTRVSRNMESAFLFVLGVSMESLSRDYIAYYQNRYEDHDKSKTMPDGVPVVKKPKITRVYSQAKVSPDGNYLVYATNELGQYKVFLQDLKNKKRPRRILKSGNKIDRINDYSYPLLTWHPSSKLFSMITEEKGGLWLTMYDMESHQKQKRTIINFDKVLDFSYSDDGKKFAMSAVQKGQSDIFVFTAASNGYEQITKDIYDDLNPRFVHGSKELIFSSNRPKDTIRFETETNFNAKQNPTTDLFVFNYVSKSNVLKRLTNTPGINETNPADYDSTHYSFLSDQNGIRNRYVARFDSVISFVDTSAHYRYVVSGKPITNFSQNSIEQDVSLKAHKISDIIYSKGKYWMYVNDLTPMATLVPVQLKNTAWREDRVREEKKASKVAGNQNLISNAAKVAQKTAPSVISFVPDTSAASGVPIKSGVPVKPLKPSSINADSDAIDINNYAFETEVPKPVLKKPEPIVDVPSKAAKDSVTGLEPVALGASAPVDSSSRKLFKLAPQKNYYINYSTDKVVTQLDNSFLSPSYQPFTASSPSYQNPGYSGLFKMGLSDVFEDYRIVAGVRLSTDLTAEYLLSYENRIRRLDRQLILHRVTEKEVSSDGTQLINVQTHEARYVLRYPFSEITCLQGTAGLRNDRTVVEATDLLSALQPNVYETWASAKLEYIFDNTLNKGLNLYNGLRFKLFAEYYRRIDQSSSEVPSPILGLMGDPNLAPASSQGTDFYVVGFDARYYQKIHRNLIWASRIAGSTSFGKEKLVYYLGGVDNWFNPQFNNNTNIATDQHYAYQTLATPIRGFIQNARNGNTFFVANNELRWPIFKYFLNRPIRSDFISNFQIIGFTDAGTAWSGPSPYGPQNNITTTVIPRNPITVTLTTQNEPLVGGAGFGLRSRIFGYFIRVDWAWGMENRVIQSEITYVSLSLDF